MEGVRERTGENTAQSSDASEGGEEEEEEEEDEGEGLPLSISKYFSLFFAHC